jgi:hypothetical protein
MVCAVQAIPMRGGAWPPQRTGAGGRGGTWERAASSHGREAGEGGEARGRSIGVETGDCTPAGTEKKEVDGSARTQD